MSAICVAGDRERLGEVVLARADVDADLAGVGVLGDEAVDRVGEPALLADLLEEARGGRAAEDRVEHRGGEAARVGARDAGRAEADVVLLGVLALEAQPGLRRAREQRPRRAAAAARGRARPSTARSHERDERVVVDAAGGGDDDVRRARRGERW